MKDFFITQYAILRIQTGLSKLAVMFRSSLFPWVSNILQTCFPIVWDTPNIAFDIEEILLHIRCWVDFWVCDKLCDYKIQI